jgi:glycerol-3-phosphate acyltransferase PlsY
VSLGSILVVISFYIQLVVFGQMGLFPVEPRYLPEVYVVGAAFSLLALWRHRANIKRLLTGTENKFGMSKKEKEHGEG